MCSKGKSFNYGCIKEFKNMTTIFPQTPQRQMSAVYFLMHFMSCLQLPASPPPEKWELMDITLMTAHIAGTVKINTLSASLLPSFPRKEGNRYGNQWPHQAYFLLASFISAAKTNTGQICVLYRTEDPQDICSQSLKKIILNSALLFALCSSAKNNPTSY